MALPDTPRAVLAASLISPQVPGPHPTAAEPGSVFESMLDGQTEAAWPPLPESLPDSSMDAVISESAADATGTVPGDVPPQSAARSTATDDPFQWDVRQLSSQFKRRVSVSAEVPQSKRSPLTDASPVPDSSRGHPIPGEDEEARRRRALKYAAIHGPNGVALWVGSMCVCARACSRVPRNLGLPGTA